MSKQKANTALPLYASIIAAVVIAAAWIGYEKLGKPGPERATTGGEGKSAEADAAAVDDAITDEAERLQYVTTSIEILDLSISPDQRPDDTGPVKGLLRVTGTALNKGARAIRSLRLVIHLQASGSGAVIGTYLEDVLDGSRLGPLEKRPFKFIIPEKPGFAGQFRSELR